MRVGRGRYYFRQYILHMKLHTVAFVLVLIGAVNWGLVGVGTLIGSNLNVVNMILGSWPMVEAIVYLLVGAAAVYEIFTHKKNCKECTVGTTGAM